MSLPITGLSRDPLDKFYTRPDVVEMCLNALRNLDCVFKGDLIVEPSAGSGAFSKALTTAFPHVKVEAYDLAPEDDNIRQQDFLLFNTTSWKQQRVHVVGNPPFGRQSGLAKRFIKKAGEHAQTIAFVLPKSFKKPSMQKCFPPLFHLKVTLELPPNSFVCNGDVHDVPCLFQVWVRSDVPRPLTPTVYPTYYAYVGKDQSDVAVRRVGVNAGKAWRTSTTHSPQSHYFLSLGGRDVEAWLEAFEAHSMFGHNNTVGPRSVSKPELNVVLNAL
jgi:hypothetical protein